MKGQWMCARCDLEELARRERIIEKIASIAARSRRVIEREAGTKMTAADRLDHGLDVLDVFTTSNHGWPTHQIAMVCAVSRKHVERITRDAMAKIRSRINAPDSSLKLDRSLSILCPTIH